MEIIKIVFFALIALFVLVTFHEYGHYWVARRCGVKVLRFSIGFGKPLLKWQRGETEFVLAGIPLGGYVKMFGEAADEATNETISEEDKAVSFSHKTVWQRMAIVVAGPVANLILAITFYFFVFLGGTQGIAPIVGDVSEGSIAEQAGVLPNSEILSVDGENVTSWGDVYGELMKRMGETGNIQLVLSDASASSEFIVNLAIKDWQGDTDEPDFLGSLGLEPFRPKLDAVIGDVTSGSAAEAAGLEVGDRVTETAEKAITSWESWTSIIQSSPDRTISMVVQREGQLVTLDITPSAIDDNGKQIGRAGVYPAAVDWPEDMLRDKSYGPFASMVAAVEKTGSSAVFILDSLKKLITGQVSTKSLGGPVSIAKIAGQSADAGWQAFLQFLAIMSVMLGVMNLMPIPVLDGGHLVFYIIEAIKGSPLRQSIQEGAMRVGMTVVFGIMILALYNDFTRL